MKPFAKNRIVWQLLHTLPYGHVKARLGALGCDGGEAVWLAVRGNLSRLSDMAMWTEVVGGTITPVHEDKAFLAGAADLLPPEPWSEATWGDWTNAVKAKTGAKGRALFHPLRLALTGQDTGPEMKALLPLIGRARTVARLGATESRAPVLKSAS